MNESQKMLGFFSAQTGKGREFPTKMAMARYLKLSDSDAAKLYKFLNGADTRYRSVYNKTLKEITDLKAARQAKETAPHP